MRAVAFVSCLLSFTSGPASADPALQLMRGTWRGDGHFVLIDTERMLANDDPEKSFQRDPLIIRNISGRLVTFMIGSHHYIGLFDRNELRLTGGSLQGSALLRR